MAERFMRSDWNEYDKAVRVLADAFGTTVYCGQKGSRLQVNFSTAALAHEQAVTLQTIETLIELVSEFPQQFLEKLDVPGYPISGDQKKAILLEMPAWLTDWMGEQKVKPEILIEEALAHRYWDGNSSVSKGFAGALSKMPDVGQDSDFER